jgi:hypothetical protein
MVDLSEFDPENRRSCKVKSLDLTEEQREKLDAVLDDRNRSTYTIRKVLHRWGKPLATQTIDKHRRRDVDGKRICGCE